MRSIGRRGEIGPYAWTNVTTNACVKTSGIVLSRIEGGGGGECAGVYVCVSGEEEEEEEGYCF